MVHRLALKAAPVEEIGRVAAAVHKLVWALFEVGDVKPMIDSTYPLRAVQQAHRRMQSHDDVGKILFTT